jgi:uncharacterized protein YicC (UPF0701 family)
MASDRTKHLKTELDGYEEQIQGMEKALRLASALEKGRIKQNIQFIREEMQPVAEEYYWRLIAQASRTSPVPEADAEPVVAEIVQVAEQTIQESSQKSTAYPAEVVALMEKILARLNQLEQNQLAQNAAGKLDVVFSLLPPFVAVAYSKELRPQELLERHFPTLMRLLPRLESAEAAEVKN